MKKYIKPKMKVREIDCELMAANSPNNDNPTSGLDNQPGNGGENDGSHSPGAKHSLWSSFDE